MEKPKVRFSQSDCVNNALEYSQTTKGKLPKTFFGKAKIISDIPVNIPIKFLGDGKILISKNCVDQAGTSMQPTSSKDNIERDRCKLTGACKINSNVNSDTDINDDETVQNNKTKRCIDALQDLKIDDINDYESVQNIKTRKCIDAFQDLKIDSANLSSNKPNLNDSICNEIFSTSNITYRSKNKKLNSPNLDIHKVQSHKNRQSSIRTQYNTVCEKENAINITRPKESNVSMMNTNNTLNAKINASDKETSDKFVTKFALKKSSAGKASLTKTMQVMPCYKSKLHGTKTKKISPKKQTGLQVVKKRILHSTLGSVNGAYVESGRPHSAVTDTRILRKDNNTPEVMPKNILSCPEYNSTIGIIERLKQVKNERLSSKNLPQSYKNLINVKVSASLDFPPDEAVFKDLIDLTVDDNELPSRLTRSKDPEPRPKDEVPQLSDFFIPEYAPEYFVTASIVSPTATNIDTFNIFKISDKINSWKNAMDDL